MNSKKLENTKQEFIRQLPKLSKNKKINVRLYKILSHIPFIGKKYKKDLCLYYISKAIVPNKSPYGNY